MIGEWLCGKWTLPMSPIFCVPNWNILYYLLFAFLHNNTHLGRNSASMNWDGSIEKKQKYTSVIFYQFRTPFLYHGYTTLWKMTAIFCIITECCFLGSGKQLKLHTTLCSVKIFGFESMMSISPTWKQSDFSNSLNKSLINIYSCWLIHSSHHSRSVSAGVKIMFKQLDLTKQKINSGKLTLSVTCCFLGMSCWWQTSPTGSLGRWVSKRICRYRASYTKALVWKATNCGWRVSSCLHHVWGIFKSPSLSFDSRYWGAETLNLVLPSYNLCFELKTDVKLEDFLLAIHAY